MSDGFERRALLEQLGEALKAVTGKPGKGPGSLVVQVAADGPVPENFALIVAQAYASWPALLLAESLDRRALAMSVRAVFKGEPKAWAKYIKAVQKDVPGFGDGVTVEAEAAAVRTEAPTTTGSGKDSKKASKKADRKADKKSNVAEGKAANEKDEETAPVEAKSDATPTLTEQAVAQPQTSEQGPLTTPEQSGPLSPGWPWKAAEGDPDADARAR